MRCSFLVNNSRIASVLFLFLFLLLVLFACDPAAKKESFKKSENGYWFKLIAFEDLDVKKNHIKDSCMAWVSAAFKTLRDSTFYDSHNDLKDRFFIKLYSSNNDHLFKTTLSNFNKGDSVCVLLPPDRFFEEQFKSAVPDFCKKDSAIKIYFKVKAMLKSDEFAGVVRDRTNNELQEIEDFFGSPEKFERARDPLGFYWVERPRDTSSAPVEQGGTVSVSYSGGFLNGRVIDVSPGKFQVVYGTPDQLLKGLNYVIGRLKMGQTSKIILPSHLAFGESGSSNGSVPPFTPMLYQISINN
ncbi:MAG: Peptidyl-prolyl cis-trans isomerase [Bacteroidetes bacterium]|jgi:hypothetical protein|nr:Peptidyl-prolyl cis-trans isomerase [Bacteroidota bacterium]